MLTYQTYHLQPSKKKTVSNDSMEIWANMIEGKPSSQSTEFTEEEVRIAQT